MTPDFHRTGPNGPPTGPEPTSRTNRIAVGYLREDLSADLGFDTVRLRLSAIAHGYTLTMVVLADSPNGDPTLFRSLFEHDAIALLLLDQLHLRAETSMSLRRVCDIVAGSTVLPRLTHDATDSG